MPTDSITRRRFQIGVTYGMWAAIAASLGAPALAYLFLPPKIRQPEDWVEAGDAARLTPGTPSEMTFRRNRIDGWKVTSEKSTAWVVKRADNSVVAFGPQCTHLGCAIHWDDGKREFLCPCHNSVFSAEGKVVSGPAPRPLDQYQCKVDGSKILLGSLIVPQHEG